MATGATTEWLLEQDEEAFAAQLPRIGNYLDMRGFPKIGVNKDYSIQGSILGRPIWGIYHMPTGFVSTSKCKHVRSRRADQKDDVKKHAS